MSRPNGLIVAIDGTAGTGKSTVGRAAAEALGYSFLSSGGLYRALAYTVFAKKINPADTEAVLAAAQALQFRFERQADATLKMFVDGEYLGNKLQLDEVAQTASKVSTHAAARAVLTDKMREAGKDGGIIVEGRDIGTVVFPDAEVKIYLDATAEVRADRRVKQLAEQGVSADYDRILASIKERDLRDSTRAASPLKAAQDAIKIDTSSLNKEQVIEAVIKEIKQHAA
ncbi:MAG: (d)CMP kinase [Elusimicrobiaceae bacterium]|nr:(d)CMP kinase [Elusimicrobiaceae bacterium]